MTHVRMAFIGSAGIPNRYGGFEAFLEHCTPVMVSMGAAVTVTCDAGLYSDQASDFQGVRRIFIQVPANGGASILHDLVALCRVFAGHSHIVALGVSGGAWFPIFRVLCDLCGKRLLVNVDGLEWRRSKFSSWKRRLLKVLDALAQRFAHQVIYDNEGLRPFLTNVALGKSSCIAYPGDYVRRMPTVKQEPGTALTVCRIEPENHLEMLIQGALDSGLKLYTIVGNWSHSEYARGLRSRYAAEPRLHLLDPNYDPNYLADLRERCEYYLHGHSVGGTNPSLVEMLFYDCKLMCLDVPFNRLTAGSSARYFDSGTALAEMLASEPVDHDSTHRAELRARYAARSIAASYLQVAQGTALTDPPR